MLDGEIIWVETFNFSIRRIYEAGQASENFDSILWSADPITFLHPNSPQYNNAQFNQCFWNMSNIQCELNGASWVSDTEMDTELN